MITNPLAPPDSMQSGVAASGSSLQLIDTVAQAILALPVVSSSVAPSLQADMEAAQALATEWNTTIREGVVNTLNGILSYNSLFESLFATLYSLSEQIASGDASAIGPFQIQLQQLYAATLNEYQAVQIVQQSMVDYSQSVSANQQVLNTDDNELQTAISNDQTKIQEGNQALDYLYTQQQIDYMKIVMNQGRPGMQEYQIIMDEINQTISTVNNQIAAVNSEINTDQQQIGELQNDLTNLSSYLTDLSQLQGGVSGLTNGWESLSGDYANLLQDEDIESYSIFTPDDVQAAASDWAELAQLAQSFLS